MKRLLETITPGVLLLTFVLGCTTLSQRAIPAKQNIPQPRSRVAPGKSALPPRAGEASHDSQATSTLRGRGWTLEDLGSLGGSAIWAYGANDAGEVVGQARRGSLPFAFRFTSPTLRDLGSLPGGDSSTAYAINNAGMVVGSSDTANGTLRAFAFDGDFRDLGTLGGSFSEAYAVNAHGQVAGTSDLRWGHAQHAFLYSEGTMRDLGTLGGSFSAAYALNDAGELAGSSWLAGAVTGHAFLFQNSRMIDLGTLGGAQSEARGINASGQVVGWAETAPGARHAFRYHRSRMHDIGTLGGGFSEAYATNDAGEVVGRSSTARHAHHAFLWRQGVMHDLNTLLPAGCGWDLLEARAINRAGQIAGSGRYRGHTRAFLLTPVRTSGNGSMRSPR